MEKSSVEELVAKYNEGLADPAEIRLLEQWIEEGKVQLTDLRELSSLDEQMVKADDPIPSMRLNDQFYTMLAEEKRKIKKKTFSFSFPDWNILVPRLAFGVAILVAGFFAGRQWQTPSSSTDVQQLTSEVSELKEMMMLSLLEKESASERLRAISLTNDMVSVSDKVTKALFETLNNDPNVNVRLSALEALTPYVGESSVREGLIRSIALQDSPLVQISMAELMVAIQEKKSVKEFQKLLDGDNMPKNVKNKIQQSIDVLI